MVEQYVGGATAPGLYDAASLRPFDNDLAWNSQVEGDLNNITIDDGGRSIRLQRRMPLADQLGFPEAPCFTTARELLPADQNNLRKFGAYVFAVAPPAIGAQLTSARRSRILDGYQERRATVERLALKLTARSDVWTLTGLESKHTNDVPLHDVRIAKLVGLALHEDVDSGLVGLRSVAEGVDGQLGVLPYLGSQYEVSARCTAA